MEVLTVFLGVCILPKQNWTKLGFYCPAETCGDNETASMYETQSSHRSCDCSERTLTARSHLGKLGELPASRPPHTSGLFECSRSSLDKPGGLHTPEDEHQHTHLLQHKVFLLLSQCRWVAANRWLTHLQHSFSTSCSSAPSFRSDWPNKSAHPALSPANQRSRKRLKCCTTPIQNFCLDETVRNGSVWSVWTESRMWWRAKEFWALRVTVGVTKLGAPPSHSAQTELLLGYTTDHHLSSC